MVSEPTLAIARTGQCAGIWRWHWTYGCALRGCAYRSVCGHMAHGACGLCVRHMAWHKSRPSRLHVRVSVLAYGAWRMWVLCEAALDVRTCAKRGRVPRRFPVWLSKLD